MRSFHYRFVTTVFAFFFVATATAQAFAGGCNNDDDCAPPTPICDIQCVECLLDFHCSEAAPRCNFSAGTCDPCTSDADCERFTASPVCGASGSCGECSAGNTSLCGDNEPVCNAGNGQCSACASNADCSANPDGPVCLATGGCGEVNAGCAEAPAAGCATADESIFRLLRGSEPARNLLLWKWAYGTTAPEDFGDPVFSTSFAVCMYREGARIASALIEPSASFWKPTRAGFRFSHPIGNLDGMLKVNLRSGNGDARIAIKGKGERLELPGLPIGGTGVVVQFVADPGSGARCWESEFPWPYGADRDDAFKSKFP